MRYSHHNALYEPQRNFNPARVSPDQVFLQVLILREEVFHLEILTQGGQLDLILDRAIVREFKIVHLFRDYLSDYIIKDIIIGLLIIAA